MHEPCTPCANERLYGPQDSGRKEAARFLEPR